MLSIKGAALLASLSAGALAYCPPTGPIVPPKQAIDYTALSKTIESSLTSFFANTKTLEDLFFVNTSATSYSVRVSSPEKTLFTYHHTAELRNISSVAKVDDDSIYRIASCSKTFTVLAVLLTEGMSPDDPISKYLPELKTAGGGWEDVTLEMLGSHIGGVPKNNYLTDMSFIAGDALSQIGFPRPRPLDVKKCESGDRKCVRNNMMKTTIKYGLINYPGGRATYSNTAFDLLGLALEKVHGKPYEDVIQDLILDPLKMKSSTFKVPPASRGAIPVTADTGFFGGFGAWDTDMGINNPTGGLFSTTKDLTSYLRGIRALLGKSKLRSWLKPRSFTSSPYEHIGTPWEIYRPTNFTPTARPIDVYTKGGSFVNFNSIIGFIPEYDLTFSVLVSAPNPQTAVYAIQNAVISTSIKSAETLAVAAVAKKYSGVYKSFIGNMTVTTDEGPGLKLSGWYNNGTDMMQSYAMLYGVIIPDPENSSASTSTSPASAAGNFTGDSDPSANSAFDIRLYAVDEEGEKWRLTPERALTREQNGLVFPECPTYFQDDIWSYNMLPLDIVKFEYDNKGGVVGLEIPVLEAKLKKQGGAGGYPGKLRRDGTGYL